MKTVAVLFARADSVYKTFDECDVWDLARDARSWPGGLPVVAHPPCRLWGSMRHKSKADPIEKQLAYFALDAVRAWGGVLEHPMQSSLWPIAGLPSEGERDRFGGWTLPISQSWWGHRARKSTRLYIVGVEPRDIPAPALRLGHATHTVGLWSGRDKATCRPSIGKGEFDATPPDLARWLVELAKRCAAPTELAA